VTAIRLQRKTLAFHHRILILSSIVCFKAQLSRFIEYAQAARSSLGLFEVKSENLNAFFNFIKMFELMKCLRICPLKKDEIDT
jgi:hypothetical protein